MEVQFYCLFEVLIRFAGANCDDRGISDDDDGARLEELRLPAEVRLRVSCDDCWSMYVQNPNIYRVAPLPERALI